MTSKLSARITHISKYENSFNNHVLSLGFNQCRFGLSPSRKEKRK